MPGKRLPEGTYIELVRSLSSTLLTTVIMAVSFIGTGVLVISETSDRAVEILTGLGALGALGRIAVLLFHRQAAQADTLTLAFARQFERRFAISYLFFAIIFGAFSARAFFVTAPEVRLLVVGLLFGYAAGVAVNLAYRPWISVSAILLAVIPTIFVATASGELISFWLALLLAVFLGGAINSMIARYLFASNGITMSRQFAALARTDPLTDLPNRLALAERFKVLAQTRGQLAVHCLDLDRFKPVNDLYGHPIGDQLLCAVAGRLSQLLRRGDMAARMGGDEFVVVQADIADASEADMLARRIVRSLALPYAIGGHLINIGTSVGYSISDASTYDLERLIDLADHALLEAKSGGGGVRASGGLLIPEFQLAHQAI